MKDNKDIMASSTSIPQELSKFDVLGKIRGWIEHQKNRMKGETKCSVRVGENLKTRNPKDEEYRTAGFHPWYDKRFYLKYYTISKFMVFDLKKVQIALSRKGFLLVKELVEFLKQKIDRRDWTNEGLLRYFSYVKILFYDGDVSDFYVSSGALDKNNRLLTIQNKQEMTDAVLHHLKIPEDPKYRDLVIGSLSLLLPPGNLNAFEFLNP